ncbi:Lectin-domain containing receptor kinase A4.3 [Hordeum vulgare]|nr:Lectin-domain containing receptor kinase A4.3 [Hordeum vulgare]
MSSIGVQDMAFQALETSKVQYNGKCFNLSHCFRVIKDEEKFKAQYAGLKSRGGKQAVEEVGDGEKARLRGETNSKKEDKRDAALIVLIATPCCRKCGSTLSSSHDLEAIDALDAERQNCHYQSSSPDLEPLSSIGDVVRTTTIDQRPKHADLKSR